MRLKTLDAEHSCFPVQRVAGAHSLPYGVKVLTSNVRAHTPLCQYELRHLPLTN